jgi:hypothetical protein
MAWKKHRQKFKILKHLDDVIKRVVPAGGKSDASSLRTVSWSTNKPGSESA